MKESWLYERGRGAGEGQAEREGGVIGALGFQMAAGRGGGEGGGKDALRTCLPP